MTTNNTTIGINYSDARLRVLVEEYITQQRGAFTLQSVCSNIVYWAMEDGRTTRTGLYESSQLSTDDCERVKQVLTKIACEGRIGINPNGCGDSYISINK